MNDRKHVVLVAVQQALLGEVGACLRAVTVTYDENSIHLACYYDGEIADDDREAMSCVETELLATFPETHTTTVQVYRMDCPNPIPKDTIWAFCRKEALE